MKDLNNKELVEISGGSEIGDAVLYAIGYIGGALTKAVTQLPKAMGDGSKNDFYYSGSPKY